MLKPNQVQAFDRDGFVNGGVVISAAQADELCRELDRVIAEHENNTPAEHKPVLVSKWGEANNSIIWQIVNIWEASPAYERLLYLPAVVEALSQLTRQRHLQVWHDQIQYKPPQHGGINNWHQDAPLWPIIKPETPVTAWIALDDVDESNGCMWMVPGSHRWGNHIDYLMKQPEDRFHQLGRDIPPPAGAEIDKIELRPWPVKRGEVSFHHSMTWHGSGANKSDRPRRAIAIHVMTGQAVFVASGEHVMKPFVQAKDGQPMALAGEHFPTICEEGQPVPLPEKIRVPVP